LHKDGCQFVCGEDLDGLAADTLDGEAFLAINGTQVMSHSCCNLADDIAGLCDAGVGRFRLWPHSFDMVAVARVYRELLDGELEVAAADDRLNAIAGGLAMANGFYHGQEGRAWVGPAA
ncbi:MAG: U32 family peptidase, partial [Alphaproteobacteria bacterium]|nr:U32 family peptidase [Alphaproteobacteria bacterium]